MSQIERTLVLVKPDFVSRGLVGEVISRLERAGLKIIGCKMVKLTPDQAEAHYGDFVERYSVPEKLGPTKARQVMDEMAGFLSSGPIMALAVEGVDAVKVVRKLVGSTYPNEAAPGTMRGDLAHVSQAHANAIGTTVKNGVHASGSIEEAPAELTRFFNQDELFEHQMAHEHFTHR